jgi:hypothetical protein
MHRRRYIHIKDTYVVCKYVKKTVFGVIPYLKYTNTSPRRQRKYVTCITIIDKIILSNYTNDAYYDLPEVHKHLS